MVGHTVDIAELFASEHKRLGRLIRRVVGNRSTAEDLVQDIFVSLLRGPIRHEVSSPRSYLSRAATNIAIDHLRRQRAQARYLAEGGLSGEEASPVPLQDAVVQGRQEWAIFRDAVDKLPPKCRVVFLLSREHGLTMGEIAARLEISEKTVEKHIARAMLDCRARLRAAGRDL